MARYIYQGQFKDGNGRVVTSGTISIFEAGGTTPANVYAAESGGSAVSSVLSDSSDGSFSFWVDDTSYGANQRFKISLSKTDFTTKSYDDIEVFPHARVAFRSFADEDATPSVKGGEAFKTANTQATTITDFNDTYDGQVFRVVINDANTTIDFTATNLKGNGGGNWTPTVNDSMDCVTDGTTVWCDISDNSA